MIRFQKIRWKNFLATGNAWIEFDFEKHNLVLITGENGVGKTTLVDALTFALFGKAYRDIPKPLLVNSINKKQMVVELNFKIGDSDFRLVRGVKPNVNELYINDVKQDYGGAKEFQTRLEEDILQFDLRTHKQILSVRNKNYVPFMDLKPEDRRGIIEEILDIKLFSVMNDLEKENRKKINADLNQAERDVLTAQSSLSELESLQNKANQYVETNMKELLDDLKSKEEEFEQLKKEYDSKNKKLEKMKEIWDDDVYNKFTETLREIDKEKTQQQVRHNEAEKMAEFFQNHKDCPTCQQKLDKKFIEKKVDFYCDEIEHAVDEMQELDTRYAETEKQKDEYYELKRKIDNVGGEVSILLSNTSMIKQSISRLKDKIEKEKVEKEIVDYTNEIETKKKSIKDLEVQIEKLKEELFLSNEAISLLKDNGTKSRIVKYYIPVINSLVNRYLEDMNFYCQFELDENFNETIKSRYRDEFVYNSFSDGQKQRIDIALLLTWREIAKTKNSVNTNLLIFDELFDSSMDGKGCQDFLNIMEHSMKDTNTIIITHNTELIDNFDRIIRFELKNNFTIMKEQMT